jgi:hypothetical protein
VHFGSGVAFGSQPFRGADGQLRSLACGSQIRSCAHQPPFPRARDLSGGPVLASFFPAGIVCCSFLVSFQATEKLQCFSTPPSYVRLTLSHYTSSPCILVHKSHLCRNILLWSTSILASTTLGPNRDQACVRCLLTTHPPTTSDQCHRHFSGNVRDDMN